MTSPGAAPRYSLPERYREPWRGAFDARVRRELRPGASVLEVGPGRRPSVAAEDRPPGTHYAAIDPYAEELAAAPPGSYDEVLVGDIARFDAALEGRFDLAVSFQVFEHVRPLEQAIGNLHAYLRPGGRLVALVSGRWSLFALVNRIVPERLGVAAMHRLIGREPDSVYRAHYDRCSYGGLQKLLSRWSEAEIVPLYRGAEYLTFTPRLLRSYVRYESWAQRSGRAGLATHYLIDATR